MPKNRNNFPNSLDRSDRSGLDPIDTYRLQGSIDGIFLRRLFTFRLRTQNFVSLFVMLVFGISSTVFMSFILYVVSISTNFWRFDFLGYAGLAGFYFICGFVWLVGVALIINFFINIGAMLGFGRNRFAAENPNRIKSKDKKKLSKRRKDFK
jgi:uncharacterized membrane protein